MSDDEEALPILVEETEIDTETEVSTENDKYSLKANQVLIDSINTIKYVIICAVIGKFAYSSRFSVWYLYAHEFDDSTPTNIVWVLYAGFFNICIVGLFYPCLSDSIGYDKTMMIMLIILSIGIFGECIATNFIFLSVFFVISQVEITAIALAYIAWILPHKYSIQYTSNLYTWIVIGYLLGPIVSGLLTYFVNYRVVFWVNFVLNTIILIMAYKCIYNKQKQLETIQLELMDELFETEIHKDYVFPVIIHNIANADSQRDKSSLSAFFRSISKFEWMQIMNVIVQNSLMISLEALLITYYPTFILDYFGGNNLIAYFQLFMVCFGFIIGNGLIPVLIDHDRNILFPFNNKYFILIVSLIVNILLSQFMYPLIENIHIFWATNTIYGFFFGCTSMVQEVFILELQPKSHTGKINGIKGLIRHITPAIAILIAGLLITKDIKYSIFYVSTGCLILSFFLAIILLISRICQAYAFHI